MVEGRKILLTGAPGTGKTTIIKKIIERMPSERVAGFITEEMREEGKRVGFRIRTLDGDEKILAHVNGKWRYRVGRYRVNVGAVDELVADLSRKIEGLEVLVIDEIGRMECLSRSFNSFVERILDDGSVFLLATVSARGGGLIEEVKKRPDVDLFKVTRENRNDMVKEVWNVVKRWFDR